jgi:hypothetical protein
MNDDTAYQLTQHVYAAIMWLFRFMENHDLTFEESDKLSVLDFHINRIDAMFSELEEPISGDPTKRIVTRLRDDLTKRRSDVTISGKVHFRPVLKMAGSHD